VDVCNETIAKKALTSGSFSGLRPGLTASVFTTRKLSAQPVTRKEVTLAA
jgi:hypothetical protein